MSETNLNAIAGGMATPSFRRVTWEGTHNGNLTLPGNTLPPSGKRQSTRATQVLTFDNNGKIKESRHYFDMLHLLQQLGAMPQVRASGR